MDIHSMEKYIENMSEFRQLLLFHTLFTHLQNDINAFKYHHHNKCMNS